MTPEQIQLVQSSYIKLNADRRFSALFYDKLFRINPKLRSLFKADMDSQHQKLMDTFDFLIGNLHNYTLHLDILRDLARRHAGYGVEAEHYDEVGQALLKALDEETNENLTADVRQAWEEAYQEIADVMITACYS